MRRARPLTRWRVCSTSASLVALPFDRAAAQGDSTRFPLPHPLMGHGEHRFNFSFSGLKTAVLNLTRQEFTEREGLNPTDSQVAADIAASFQKVVAEVLVSKTVIRTRVWRRANLYLWRGERQCRATQPCSNQMPRGGAAPLHSAPLPLHRQCRHDRCRRLLSTVARPARHGQPGFGRTRQIAAGGRDIKPVEKKSLPRRGRRWGCCATIHS